MTQTHPIAPPHSPTPLSSLPFASAAFKYLFASSTLPSSTHLFTVFKPAIYRHFALKTQQSVEEHASEDLHAFMAVYYKTLIARPLYMQLKACLESKQEWESSTDEIYRMSHKIQEMWRRRRKESPTVPIARTVSDSKVFQTPCLVDFIDYRGATMEHISDETIGNYTSLKECLQETLIDKTTSVITSASSALDATSHAGYAMDESTVSWITDACSNHIARFTSQDTRAHKNKVDLLSAIIDKMEPLHTNPVCQDLLEEKYAAYLHFGVQSGEFTETSNKYFACEMQHQMQDEWQSYEECYNKNASLIAKQTDPENIEYCRQEIYNVLDGFLAKEEDRIQEYKAALRQEEGRLF